MGITMKSLLGLMASCTSRDACHNFYGRMEETASIKKIIEWTFLQITPILTYSPHLPDDMVPLSDSFSIPTTNTREKRKLPGLDLWTEHLIAIVFNVIWHQDDGIVILSYSIWNQATHEKQRSSATRSKSAENFGISLRDIFYWWQNFTQANHWGVGWYATPVQSGVKVDGEGEVRPIDELVRWERGLRPNSTNPLVRLMFYLF